MRLARTKKRAQGARAKTHSKKVQLAEIQLQRDPTNEEVTDILSDSQGKLAEVFQDFVACNRHFTSANWHKYGHTCLKTFFDFHGIGKKKTHSYDILGARMLWKPKEARILTNFINQPV
jgi:hypothetical protein